MSNNLHLNGYEIDDQHLSDIISRDGKLQAIKYVMNHANAGLKEAKDFVENFMVNKPAEIFEGDVLQHVKNLLKNHQKIEAIKEVRENTGMGLKESKDFVDNIDNVSLEDLLKNFKGKKLSQFSSSFDTIDKDGNITNHHNFEKTWEDGKVQPTNKPYFTDETKAKSTQRMILFLAAIFAIAYYLYYNNYFDFLK